MEYLVRRNYGLYSCLDSLSNFESAVYCYHHNDHTVGMIINVIEKMHVKYCFAMVSYNLFIHFTIYSFHFFQS